MSGEVAVHRRDGDSELRAFRTFDTTPQYHDGDVGGRMLLRVSKARGDGDAQVSADSAKRRRQNSVATRGSVGDPTFTYPGINS